MLQSPDHINYSHAREETGRVEMIPEIIHVHVHDNRVIADNTRQICVDGIALSKQNVVLQNLHSRGFDPNIIRIKLSFCFYNAIDMK